MTHDMENSARDLLVILARARANLDEREARRAREAEEAKHARILAEAGR